MYDYYDNHITIFPFIIDILFSDENYTKQIDIGTRCLTRILNIGNIL